MSGDELNAGMMAKQRTSAVVGSPQSNPPALSVEMVRRIASGLRMYQRPFGIRGMLALCGHRLFGWPERLNVTIPGIKDPVVLRMRTTDVSICEQVLFQGHNAFALEFVPDTIVDVGANIGMVSIFYANRYPNARIVAVEAEPSNFEILLQNVKHYSNILPFHAALWDRDGQVSLIAPGGNEDTAFKVGFAVHAGEGVPVRAITVRTLMKEAGISSIDLLKIDIEGAEKEVFETASDWIDNVRCLAIELHDRFKPGCREAVRGATGAFRESHVGETVLYLKKSSAMAAGTESH